ncbi:MAG TPA: tetratricopeptide repeat protein [Tepidisphaeraceae bacterium]
MMSDSSPNPPARSLDELINAAINFQQQGDLDTAEALYREAITIDPEEADAHNLLGTLLQARGDIAGAVDAHRRATAIVPQEASFHFNLGMAYKAGRSPAAIDAFSRAAELDPESVETLSELGGMLVAAGRPSEGAAAFEQAIRLRSGDPLLLTNLGIARRHERKLIAAIVALREACELAPSLLAPRDLLVRVFHEAGTPAEARDHAAKLVELAPDEPDSKPLLLVTLNADKQYERVIELCREYIKLEPERIEFHFQLAVAFQCTGEFAASIIALRRCLEIEPRNIAVLNRLGYVLYLIGQAAQARDVLEETTHLPEANADTWMTLSLARIAIQEWAGAVEAGRKALDLAPTRAAALLQLVVAVMRSGDHDEVERLLENAEDRVGAHMELHMQRGSIAGERGNAAEAVEHFKRAMALDPSVGKMGGVAAMFLNYLDTTSASEVFAAHCRWADQFADVTSAPPRYRGRSVEPERKLRIGYLSPDFRGHSVAFFLQPLLEHHDRSQFHVVCFDNTRTLDTVSGKFHSLADEWHRVVGISDEAVADVIAKHGVDLLIDLAGHTSDSRLAAMAYRPAPVQVSYLGYPNTTGLPTVDYRIVDAFTDPPGASEALSREKLVRIDPIFLSYAPLARSPDIETSPLKKNGFITFGSFNNFLKVSDTTMAMWCEVLRTLPTSRLLLKSNGLANPTTRQRVSKRFESLGVDPARVEFVSRMAQTTDHLALYNRVDVALDTYPYAGTTTTCEASWMGVPVVTRCGKVHASRVGGSILRTLGLESLIADDHEGYVKIAVALAGDARRLAALRQSLRQRMTDSPLTQHQTFVRKLETAYRQMWRDWCATQSAH